VVNATPRPLYLRERDPVPIVLEAGWAPGPKRYTFTLSLTSALEEVGGQIHAPAALPPGKRPGTHCIGGWMGPRAEEVFLYSFFNLGARWSGWSTPRPGRFIPGKDPVPIVQEAVWAPVPVWTGAENPGSSSP